MADADLQFDHAEYSEKPAPLACSGCQQPIAGTYFQAGATTVCPACREAIEQHQARRSGVRGFLRASFFGLIAAAAGSLLYFGIGWLTGYNIGLISIFVGIAVGQAVRIGSGGRGGLLYQLLAVFLTYSSIVTTYIPYIVEGVLDAPEKKVEATVTEKEPAPSPARVVASLIVVGAFLYIAAFTMPFLLLSGGVNGLMGVIIIAIGLMEAWRSNQYVEVAFSGPYELASAPAG